MHPSSVYLLDDEPDQVDLLREFVEMSGMKAQGYTHASQFFEQISTNTDCDILVLDLQMPGMDGIEVMRRLNEIHVKPALILISGHDTSVLSSAEKLGRAHDFEIIASMNKPLNMAQFQSIIKAHSPVHHKQANSFSADNHQFTASEILHGIHQKQLILHYQPQVDISTNALSGVEALVRWQHPQHGLIFPDRFIPQAEAFGLMGDLTNSVIKLAMQQEQRWLNNGLAVVVSVNISSDNITSLSLPEQLEKLLDNNQLDPGCITLEITESALMGDLITSLDILTRLRLKGIKLSIDDFGTGFSSLSQLHRIPFSELKIDRSFVGNMVHDDEARAIVKTCIMLSHELKMHVVAEGIEDQQTWDMLKNMGCDLAQGYFVAKPMPAADLLPWVTRQKKMLDSRPLLFPNSSRG